MKIKYILHKGVRTNIMLPSKPFNTTLMYVDDYIKENHLNKVTSYSIFVASTNDFHPDGLFSEEIFGEIGSPERNTSFGYIELNTPIFQPQIYKTIIKLKNMYNDIMNGTVYAKFNEDVMDFERCSKDDMDADTGYSFFIKYISRVQFEETGSQKRADKIALLNKYRDNWFCNKFLILPAGLRDIRSDSNRLEKEDINKLYISLMSYSDSLPKGINSPIYDSLKMNITKKAYEIYCYIENIITGKKGFLRGQYAKRNIAYGTRNVISSTPLNLRTPDDKRGFQFDETICPLYQTMKAAQPIVLFQLRNMAFDAIFNTNSSQISVINKKTYELVYSEFSMDEVAQYKTDEGLNSFIHNFSDVHMRHNPITITDVDGKEFYMFLVYDKDDKLTIFRDKNSVRTLLGEDMDKYTRPLTWAELCYIATYTATHDKHVYITRYPIGQGPDSVYPSKIRLHSTTPNREVTFFLPDTPEETHTMPHYPIVGGKFVDSLSPFPGRFESLAGDCDGDMVSMNLIGATDANAQIREFLNSPHSLISTSGKLYCGGNTGLCKYTLYNLTMDKNNIVK